MGMRVRAVAALPVLVLFPVVVLALVVGVVAGGFYLGSFAGILGVKVAWIAIPVAWALFSAVRDVWRSRPEPMAGVELDRRPQPAFWAVVDDLADRMQTERPQRVVVNGTVNAAVTQVGGHREMVIGLPLLAGMSRDELVSVLAHELGHFASGHTRVPAGRGHPGPGAGRSRRPGRGTGGPVALAAGRADRPVRLAPPAGRRADPAGRAGRRRDAAAGLPGQQHRAGLA
jgi:Zn-dependent protease with chaperone function